MKRLSACQLLVAVAMSQGILSSCAMLDRITGSDVTTPADELLGKLSLRVLHKADYNIDDRPTVSSFLVVTDAEAYASELKKYSVEFPATINFNTESIVLATMGTQPSGGYAITAIEAADYNDKVILRFELVSPAENCQTTQAQSNPYEFVLVPTTKPIEFDETPRVQAC